MKSLARLALVLATLALVEQSTFAADSIGKQAVRTNAVNDLQTELTGADGSSIVQGAASNTVAAANGLFVLGATANSALPSYTAGRATSLQVDLSGRLYVTTDATANLRTDAEQLLGAAISVSNPFPSRLSDGAAYYVGTKTGQLPTSLGSATSANSLAVVVASDQGAISTKLGAPTGFGFNRATPVNIASAATTAIVCKGSLAVSQPTKVYQVVITGAASARCVLRFNDNTAMTNFADVETSAANPTVIWTPPPGFTGLTTSSTVTTLQYEANCTNFDSAGQDFGCAISYCQAASGC